MSFVFVFVFVLVWGWPGNRPRTTSTTGAQPRAQPHAQPAPKIQPQSRNCRRRRRRRRSSSPASRPRIQLNGNPLPKLPRYSNALYTTLPLTECKRCRKQQRTTPAHNHAHKLSAQPCAQPLRTTFPAQPLWLFAQGFFFRQNPEKQSMIKARRKAEAGPPKKFRQTS